ncbi:MAG TPA: hypothetical protein VMW17_06630 [Candidatus Binatia bacterium]|nr:hypothetical protein [Candidatus Binatia bacterium]
MRSSIIALTFAGLLAGCGDGGVVIFSFNSGLIESDATCTGSGGQFHLREASGLTVLVVLTGNSTIILAGGGHGNCGDLHANTPVTVQGSQQGTRITAQTVTVQST